MNRDPLSRHNVTVAGNPEAAETLLFVHGLGTDQSAWRDVAAAFRDEYRMVLFDNVGAVASNQGDFQANQSRYLNISGYATDILEICSALKLPESTTLVGHSLGAMAGVLASIQSPRQFKALVLLGTSPRYRSAEGYEGGFTTADIDRTYGALMSNYPSWTRSVAESAMGNPDQPHLADRLARSMARVPKELMLTVLCSVLQMDHRDALPKVTVPTLLIQARDDYFVPLGVARYVQEHMADCRLAMIDAAGHLPHVSAPDMVVEAMKGFLSRKG